MTTRGGRWLGVAALACGSAGLHSATAQRAQVERGTVRTGRTGARSIAVDITNQ
jgi:hypothetical protein